MADVFISYKREDLERVEHIASLLKGERLSVWFDAHLEAGRAEGYDAEIEREVTSAFCVLACWTPEAVKSRYVKAEAKKGLEREVLLPVFLQTCTVPVPFNIVDAIDLTRWDGDAKHQNWQRVLSAVKARVDRAQADLPSLIAHARAAYTRIDDKIYPGMLADLAPRIAATGDMDTSDYGADIHALLAWMTSIAKKECRAHASEYSLADRMAGKGIAWMFWDTPSAHARAAKVRELRAAVATLDAALAQSIDVLTQPAP